MRKNDIIKDNVISKDRDFKGVWVPRKLYLSGIFSPNEKFVLIEIYSLSKKNKCYATNKHFADFVGLRENTIQKMMLEFERAGYIKRIFEYKEDSKEIKNRIIILTQKFLDEFINEKAEDNNEYPHGKKSIRGMEKNPEGDGEKVGDKYNNISNTYLSNNINAFTKVNDNMYALTSKDVIDGDRSCKKNEYTNSELKNHIYKTINHIMMNYFWAEDNCDECKELVKIILYFYKTYNGIFVEKHPIVSYEAYKTIVHNYLYPYGRNMEDIHDFDTYTALIDKYFEENYNARGNYKGTIQKSLSHFMSGEIRDHLCNREGVFWERCDD